MKYKDLPDELRERLDDLLDDQQGDFEAVLDALDHWIDEGVRNERTRVARLAALRSVFDDVPARDQVIDDAIVSGGNFETTKAILEAMAVGVVTEPAVDTRTRLFDRAILNGTEPGQMEDL